MTLILTTPGGPFSSDDWSRLAAACPPEWGVRAVNEQDGEAGHVVAAEMPDDSPATEQDWAAVVAAYTPPAPPAEPDPLALLAQAGADLAAIPSTATSTQMRSALRAAGQKILDSIPET